MWEGHVRALPEFSCLRPDLPGHGTASGRPWRSLAATAADIAGVIERTPAGRADLVAISLGGAVAIQIMNRRPDLIDRVMIDGASAVPWRFAPVVEAGAMAVSPFIHTLPFMRLIAQVLSVKGDRRSAFYEEVRLVDRASFRTAVRDAFAARLTNWAFPGRVLLVAGEHDAGATRVSNATLAAALPDAAAVFLPRTLHAWVGTNPELHKRMVRAFLMDEPLPRELELETSVPRRR